jgi:hypothetical protein
LSRIVRGTAAAALAAVAVLGVSAGVWQLGRPAARAVSAPDVGTLPATTATPAPPAATTSRPAPAAGKVAEVPPAGPVRVTLPGTSAPVVAVGVRPGGALEVPESPDTVGWWSGSAPAGGRGSTLLVGHVDSAATGVGVFAELRDVRPGARVVLTDVFGGRHPYTVQARRTYPKYSLPPAVFRAAPLVLVTCGGPFDAARGSYRDNIVVYATLS